MTTREEFLEQLNAAHVFPTAYTFKLIAINDEKFLASVLGAVLERLPESKPEIRKRESSKGRHQSLTLVIDVPNAETVVDLYERFHALEGLHMLL